MQAVLGQHFLELKKTALCHIENAESRTLHVLDALKARIDDERMAELAVVAGHHAQWTAGCGVLQHRFAGAYDRLQLAAGKRLDLGRIAYHGNLDIQVLGGEKTLVARGPQRYIKKRQRHNANLELVPGHGFSFQRCNELRAASR